MDRIGQTQTLIHRFLHDWALFRRQMVAYPEDHPMVKEAADRVVTVLNTLMADRDQVEFGVLKDSLLLNGGEVSASHPAVNQLATTLHRHGVAVIRMARGIDRIELVRFSRLLATKPERMKDEGGLLTAAHALGFEHIQLTPLTFDVLETTEEKRITAPTEPDDLWRRFIGELLAGRSQPAPTELNDPRLLAELVNAAFEDNAAGGPLAEFGGIGPFFSGMESIGQTSDEGAKQVEEHLLIFFSFLKPAVRRALIEGGLTHLGEDTAIIERLLARLPVHLVREMLQSADAAADTPPRLFRVLKKLKHPLRHALSSLTTSSDQLDQMRTILREDESEVYIEDSYRSQLESLENMDALAAPISGGALAVMIENLQGNALERHACNVVLEVAKRVNAEERAQLLTHNLQDICRYFLELGDFDSLLNLHEQLKKSLADLGRGSDAAITQALQAFEQTEFLEEVLESLRIWGKPKYEDVRRLILRVGTPFIDPLLQRLATEESMSLRRYYMDCLTRFGALARPYLQAQLTDSRWFFLRNLILLLRTLDEPGILDSLEELLNHPHLRVRQEVLRTFIHFNDHRGTRTLLAELDNPDAEELLSAIRIADKSHSPVILRKLLSLFSTKDLTDEGLRVQTAIVRSLGEIGHPDALPVLKKALDSLTLLRPFALTQLKAEIARSLGRYPVSHARELVDKLATSRISAIADAAAESQRLLARRTNG